MEELAKSEQQRYSTTTAAGWVGHGSENMRVILVRSDHWLNHAIEYGFCNPYFLEHEPYIEDLRRDERFESFIEKAKRPSVTHHGQLRYPLIVTVVARD